MKGSHRTLSDDTPAVSHPSTTRWQVYILRCGDGTLYTGITIDLEKRLDAHHRGVAAKYTRHRRPLCLAYSETQPDRGSALKREAALKKMRRVDKLALIGSCPHG